MSAIVPEVVNRVTALIAEIDPDKLNDREVIAYLAGISETASGMLGIRPDLKAHADLVMDLANRVFYANDAAEARGYAKAVANLRAYETRWEDWRSSKWGEDHRKNAWATGPVLADYLEAEATKETTDHA